jgi:hypothetical protein
VTGKTANNGGAIGHAIVSGMKGAVIVKGVDIRRVRRNRGDNTAIRGPRIAIRASDRAIAGKSAIDRGTNPRKLPAVAVRSRGASKPVPAAQARAEKGKGHASGARITLENESRTGHAGRGALVSRVMTTSSHGGPSGSLYSAI